MNIDFLKEVLSIPSISGDEQDIGFKGKYPDKQRVTFKKEGDRFLVDALCDDGFTLTFYFRNMPAPRKWVDQGFSPGLRSSKLVLEVLQL